jgi:hypothetical protein
MVAIVAAALVAGMAATAGLSGTTRTAVSAQGPCVPQHAQAPSVGQILHVVGIASLGKATLGPADQRQILRDSTLCTDLPPAAVRFVVYPRQTTPAASPTTCHMTPESRLRVWPPKSGSQLQVIVRFEGGNSWCETGPATETSKFDANAGKVRLILQDPLFGVGFYDPTSRTATVKVQSGYVEVSRLSGNDPGRVIVGAGQQVDVPDGGEPAAVEQLGLTADDNAAIADLPAPATPPPLLGPPSAAGSPTLAAMFKNHLFTLDYDSTADAQTAVFLRSYFGLLATKWHMKMRFVPTTPAVIAKSATTPGVLGAVSDLTPFGAFGALPLFVEPAGTPWYVVYNPDDVFASALANFVAATVASGDYANDYRAAYDGAEPDLRPLEKILFP